MINKHLPITGESCFIDSKITACLLLLLKSPQTVEALVARYCKLFPTNPLTLETVTKEDAWKTLQKELAKLEREGFLLIECDILAGDDIKDSVSG